MRHPRTAVIVKFLFARREEFSAVLTCLLYTPRHPRTSLGLGLGLGLKAGRPAGRPKRELRSQAG